VVPEKLANILQPERRSGKRCLSQPEILQRSGKSVRSTISKLPYARNWFSGKSLKLLPP